MRLIKTMIVLTIFMAICSLPAHATRRERVNGVVEGVDSNHITIASKSYRFSKQFRVILITREGNHRYEKKGNRIDIRGGEKVTAVVSFDEISDLYIERY